MVTIAPQSGDGGFVTDDPSWLGSAHGTDSTETGTVDTALFTAGTHYPDGFLPSGTPLAKVTATGLYGPYTPGNAPAGTGTLVGFLIAPRAVASATQRIAVGILTHGKVVEANLPTAIDADAKTDVAGRIRFI
jgi:hypothetical protein